MLGTKGGDMQPHCGMGALDRLEGHGGMGAYSILGGHGGMEAYAGMGGMGACGMKRHIQTI
jgi:hypothetical protein